MAAKSSVSLETLPQNALATLLSYLDAIDLERLGQANKYFLVLSRNELLWKALCQDVFGVTLDLQARLTEAGVDFDEPHRRSATPENWRSYYKMRTMSLQGFNEVKLESQYSQVQNTLEALADEATGRDLGVVCSMVLDILDVYPYHAPSFYSLAFVCFLLNAYGESQHLIDAGLALDPTFTLLLELRVQVENELSRFDGNEEDASLIDEDGKLSEELRQALQEIFNRFDRDHDRALSHGELSNLILTLNGTPPSPVVLRNLTQNYRSNGRGLLFEGFLEFYRRQTLDEPEETRNDLSKLGYSRALVLNATVATTA